MMCYHEIREELNGNMHEDAEEFLREARALIRANKRRFIKRENRDYLKDLFDLGIESRDQAWRVIRSLRTTDQSQDAEPDEDGSGKLVWFFHKQMENGIYAYIKLTIDERGCIRISCHPVEYGENRAP
jgi:hypothetical protein